MESSQFPHPLSKFEEYTAIGFDIDHCLTRYRIPELSKLIYNTCIENLKSLYNYPDEIFQNEADKDFLNFAMNFLAIDVKNGNIIKLGNSCKVLRAYNGTDLLTETQIKQIYGEEKTLKNLDPMIDDRSTKVDVFLCLTLFEHIYALLFAKTIQFKKTFEPWKNKTNKEIQTELNDSYMRSFVFWDYKGKSYKMQEFSLFYKEIYENVEKYVYPQEELFKILKHLKDQGKFLFIASNSPYPYVKLTMDHGLGKDWPDLFDLIIYNSGKPNFFTNHSKEFYELDVTNQNDRFKGGLLNYQTYKHAVGGNVKTLENLINEKTGKINGRKIFIGDNLICDNAHCSIIPNWDTINLLEELQEFDDGNMFGGLNYQSFWGSFFYEEVDGKKVETFWPDFIRRNCSVCYPLLLCQKFKDFVNYK